MDHRTYPKIGTRADSAPGGRWVALEKLHGANLVLGCDGDTVRIGGRRGWLGDGDGFFGWQLLRPDLEAAARAVQAALGGAIFVYGELFGGRYPHPDVPAVPGVAPVQTGIWYAPEIRYAAFDVLVDDTLLAHHEVEDVAARCALAVAPRIAWGSRSELERLPVRFSTRVPAQLGLPPLPDNLAEGLVLKPDARAAPAQRATIKRKLPDFDDRGVGDGLPWDPTRRLDRVELTAIATRLVNPVRRDSARSKLGDLGGAAALRDEIVLDVLIDLEEVYPRAMAELDEPARRALHDHLAALAATLSAPREATG